MLWKIKLTRLLVKCLQQKTFSLHAKKSLSSLTPFTPLTLDLRGQTVTIEETTEGDIRGIAQLLIQASAAGDGYGTNQFKSEEDVKALLSQALRCIKISKADDELLGIYGITDSPFSRSEKAFYGNSFIFLDKAIRGQGVSTKLLRHVLPAMIPGKSYLTRTVVTGVGITPLLRAGWTCVGTIPNSVDMANIGWTDDLLVCSSKHFDEGKSANIDEKDLRIPPLKKTVAAETNLNQPFPRDISLPDLTIHGTTFNILQATSDNLWEVEDMVRRAALQGHGFALDEFNPEGHLNRSLLKDNHLLVVKDGGHLVAGIIFGASGASRGRNPGQVAGYMVVTEDMRGRGVGGRLLGYCMDNAHLLGYTAILTDVFCTNSLPLGMYPGMPDRRYMPDRSYYSASGLRTSPHGLTSVLGMLLRRGFLVTATLPNCGVVAGRGRTNSLLFYKPLGTRE